MMAEHSNREVSLRGLWRNHPALVQLLALSPLLAVSVNVVNAMALGLVTTLVMVFSNATVSMIHNGLPDSVRIPAFVLIIATAVTVIELLMQAFAYNLVHILGIFLPLIATNVMILGRADEFAARNALLPSLFDGLLKGLGFAAVLTLLGGLREVAGTGALFANLDLLFGPGARDWKVLVFPDYQPLLLAILPPGAFIFTGLLIAVKNVIDDRFDKRHAALKAPPVHGARRVRVTGSVS